MYTFIYSGVQKIYISLSHSLGPSVNLIEPEKIADPFDKDRGKTIDWSEIGSVHDQTYQQKIDKEIKCTTTMSLKVNSCIVSRLYYCMCTLQDTSRFYCSMCVLN